MENISTIRDLVNLWPTRAELASDLKSLGWSKISVAQIHKWAENSSIPSKYHLSIINAAGHRGFPINADLVVRLHDAARSAA